MDLATLMQQAALLNQQQMAQGQQVSDMLAGASQTASETSQVLQQSASDTREAELTRLEGELKTQNARVKVANAYGTNVNAQSDVITPLAEVMRQTAVDLTKAQAEVQRIDANSDLLGNPLGWLEDLVRGDEVRGQRDALAQSLEQQSKTAQALNAATQSSIQTQNAITETLTTTSIKQIANVKAADAQVKAANWQVEAAKLGASSVEALSQVGAQNFARMAQMYSLGQQAESMALARAERAERLKDKQAVENELQDITDNINAYNKTYGRPEVPTSFVKRYYGTQGEYGDELRHADVSGMRIRQSGGTEGSLGAKPSEAYMRIESGAVQTPAAWKPSVDVLKEAEAQFNTFLDERDKTTGKTNRESLKGEALKDAFDNQVKDVAARYSKRIEYGKGNPFQVPNIETVIQSPTKEGKELANSNYRKFVLDSLVATGIPDPSPEQLMATAASAVERGDISMSDAIKYGVQYFREGHGLKLATGGFTTLNIPVEAAYPVPSDFLTKGAIGRVSYNVFGTGSSISAPQYSPEQESLKKRGQKMVNLTDPQDFTTAMTIMMSQRRAQQITNALKGQQQ